MPERPEYKKLDNRLGLNGLSVSRRRDLIDSQKLSYARNIRIYSSGEIRPRRGLGTKLGSSPTASTSLHTLRRFNDPTTAAYKFILGAADKLYLMSEAGSPTELVTGLSQKKVQCVFSRPARSAKVWSYLTDQTGMYKLSFDGSFQNWSIRPLNSPITATVGSTAHKVIDSCESSTGWSADGVIGTLSGPTSRLSFTIGNTPTAIIYDSGTTGWCFLVPSAMDSNYQSGALLTYNPGGGTEEQAYIESVSEAIASTTIASITYDSGSTGLCTVQLTNTTANIQINGVIKLTTSGSSEYCRIIEVVDSPVHTPTIRVKTTLTHAAATVVDGAKSYRTYLRNNHAAGETVQGSYLRCTASGAGTAYLTKTSALNLLTSSTSPTSTFQPDDLIHISLRPSDPSLITEIQVMLDFDSGTNDFTRNYFYYAIQPSAFTTSSTTLTAAQVSLQRDQIIGYRDPSPDYNYGYSGYDYSSGAYYQDYQDYRSPTYDPYISPTPTGRYTEPVYGVSSNPTGVSDASAGTSQWTELNIKIGDFKRIGSDNARGWGDIAAIRVKAMTTGGLTIDIDSWYVRGGGNLNTGAGADYNWVIVPRNRLTGDVGLPCPPLRSGLTITQGSITGTFTSSSDSQVTDYDIYRFGGTLLDFRYVMSIPHTGQSTTHTFIDNYGDETIAINPVLSRDNYPVFPQLDQPRAGEATIKGTLLTRTSGDNFDTLWAPGSQINLTDSSGNAYLCKLYASPTSTTVVEIDKSLNLSGTLKWAIPEPVILGKATQSIWGPYGGGFDATYIFGCGSSYQPGTLFWTNPNSPGTSSLRNQLEITSPQEPLIGGCLYDGQCFVFSTERMFRVFATGDTNDPFRAQEVANSKGLVSPFCLTVGQVIYFLGKDGLYATTGGQPYSLSDRDLYPLFPHDSQAGETTNTIAPVDYAQKDNFHIAHHNDYLYFTYINTSAARRTIVFDTSRASYGASSDIDEVGRWVSIDDHSPVVSLHYAEEGTVNPRLLAACLDGNVYSFDANRDNSVGFTYEFETKSFDFNSPDNKKFIPQIQIDADLGGLSCNIYARSNLSSTTLLQALTASSREISQITMPSNLRSLLSLGVLISGTTSASATPKFYTLFIDHSEITPDQSSVWYSQATSNDLIGWQHIREAYIAYNSTTSVTFTILVDGSRTYTYTLPTTTGTNYKHYLPTEPIKGRIFEFTFSASAPFRLYVDDSEIRIKSYGSREGYNIIRPVSTI